ncbi:hypothetical protein [Psychrobacter sp. FDAARGOS_221]|uniref:hypothetical protein n=1 Tax=Psychrobacter sp. FDAARGOS_221 TaxID=1975705 RepID=UPI000BB56660|nr:hypothetical protein [Psychrobacter sp. FDAARGOS_221]PNK60801.1 hypothetical protein A6J60_007875 [Psychrobacter sp. FDAARGOS_221]
MTRGIKTLAVALASLLTISGCATLKEVQERNIEKQAMRSLPTAEEYQDILDAVKTIQPTTLVGSEKPKRWLLVNETPPLFGNAENEKEYLDVDSPYRSSNVAFGDVKSVKASGAYTDTSYRVFCEDGYYRAYTVTQYTRNHNKIPWLLSRSDDHDTGVFDHHIKMAKHICALSGFYKGMPDSSKK